MARHIKVIIEPGEDGGIKVRCDELPGLILAGKERARIIGAIEPAVRALLARKGESADGIVIDADFVGSASF